MGVNRYRTDDVIAEHQQALARGYVASQQLAKLIKERQAREPAQNQASEASHQETAEGSQSADD